MEEHELLFLDDGRDGLQDVVRALGGGVRARKLHLEPSGHAPFDPRITKLVLLPAYDCDGCPTDTTVAAIRSRSPHTPLFVWAPALQEVQGRLPSLAWAGADHVFVVSTPSDRSALTDAIRRRLLAPPPADILRALAKSQVAPDGKTFAMWLLRNGCFPIGAKDARVMFGRDLKTLQKLLAPLDKIGVMLKLGITLHADELHRRGVVGKAAAERLGLNGSGSLWHRHRFISQHEFTPILRDIIASSR